VALSRVDDDTAGLLDRAGALAIAGDIAGAVELYRRLLTHDPRHRAARRNIAVLLIRAGHTWDSLEFWQSLGDDAAVGRAPIDEAIERAMRSGDLSLASELASVAAAINYGSDDFPPIATELPALPGRTLTPEKLRHDAEQLDYLGIVPERAKRYRKVSDDVDRTPSGRADLERHPEVGDEYGRIIHVADTQPVDVALGDWEGTAVEADLAAGRPPVAVIDDFLTEQALNELRRFCWESTIWNVNRYDDGRLAAFFSSGFNSPLLIQIAEELQERFAAVLRRDHTLRQIWAFKYPEQLDSTRSLHADFAGVNVNFWITPDVACLDPDGGGLTVYDAEAPADWTFHQYNESPQRLAEYVAERSAERLDVPYRSNRAVVFVANLIHATAQLEFRPGYQNRRISVTMLFGDRHDQRRWSR
jgi:hypothetical protein